MWKSVPYWYQWLQMWHIYKHIFPIYGHQIHDLSILKSSQSLNRYTYIRNSIKSTVSGCLRSISSGVWVHLQTSSDFHDGCLDIPQVSRWVSVYFYVLMGLWTSFISVHLSVCVSFFSHSLHMFLAYSKGGKCHIDFLWWIFCRTSYVVSPFKSKTIYQV